MRNSLASFVLPLIACSLSAQGPQTLVGLTRTTTALRTLSLDCQGLAACPTPGMPAAGNVFAGGTAWDPVESGAWVTNGKVLAKYGQNCDVQCAPFALPAVDASTFITGMAVVDSVNQLWMIDNNGRIRWFTNTCPPTPVDGCNTTLVPTPAPQQQITTGLAIDEGIGLIFISYPNLNTGSTRIAVHDLSNPCVPFDMFTVPSCLTAFGAVTGLAVDWDHQLLYATDGSSTVSMNYAWNGTDLTIVGFDCCPAGVAIDPMVGLAVRPGRATRTGQPCSNGVCAPCPMIHRLRNDPVIGNLDFRLGLDEAFGSSFSFCLIGAGPCNSPGVSSPDLCGPIYTIPFLGYLGANLIQGPSICGGSTDFLLAIPATPALVGEQYSSQCLNLCFNAIGLGFSLSNCLSWELQGI